MRDTTEVRRKNSLVTFSYGSLHTDVQVLDNKLEIIQKSSVRSQDVV